MTLCMDCQRAAFRTVTVPPAGGVKSPSRSQSFDLPSHISTIADATTCLEFGKRWLKKEGFAKLDNITIEFGGSSQLAASGSSNAAAMAVLGRDKIVTKPGHETVWALGAFIHELGHHWLHKHGVPYVPDQYNLDWRSEGFCELLMYRFLCAMDTYQSRYEAAWMEENPSYHYGDGFRAVKAAADRIGFRQFVDQIKRGRRIVA